MFFSFIEKLTSIGFLVNLPSPYILKTPKISILSLPDYKSKWDMSFFIRKGNQRKTTELNEEYYNIKMKKTYLGKKNIKNGSSK